MTVMLTIERLKEIKDLQHICEENDRIELKLNWDMLESKDRNEKDNFYHYDQNGRLIGFLALYGFGNKVEICGMIHPENRRNGIFSGLMMQGLQEAIERNTTTILLNAPTESQSAKAFLAQVPCTFKVAEYQMKWHETGLSLDDTVTLRPSATEEDVETEIQLEIQCFGYNEKEAREFNKMIKNNEKDQYLMIETDGRTVGKMRVSEANGESWIYGFAVMPEYQGKGIGRKALTNVVIEENKKGFSVFLEVEAKNAHALRLYESCGFKAYHSQDYYEYSLQKESII